MRFCFGNGEDVECKLKGVSFAGQRLCPKQLGLEADKEKDDEWLSTRNIALPQIAIPAAYPFTPESEGQVCESRRYRIHRMRHNG